MFEEQFISSVKNKHTNVDIFRSEKIQTLFDYLGIKKINMAIAFLSNPICLMPCVQDNLESNLDSCIATLMGSYDENIYNKLSYVTVQKTMIIFNSSFGDEQKLDKIYNLDKLQNMKAFW